MVSCGPHQRAALKQPKALPAYARGIDKQILNAADAGDGDYALRVLRARLDANPRDLAARLELAERYRQLGFTEVALEHGRLACERAPDSDEAHTALAKMLRDAARAPEAAHGLEVYAASHSGAGASVWAWLGLLRDDTGDWKAGETAHRKALALDPKRDEFHNNLGYCLLRQGRRDEAAGEFRIALQLRPQSAIAENNLGMALAGESREAVAHLQVAADAATAHNNLAVALMEAGRLPEARQEIEVALGYNRAHSAALNNLRLLAELDGGRVELGAWEPARGRWSRMVVAWRRLWNNSVPDSHMNNPADHHTSIDRGSSVASR
jgi:Flp pilus assembly protein TadD